MFKGVARVTVYLLLIIPLILIGILIVRQIQYAFDLRKSILFGSQQRFPYADMQQIMATNELSTRSFFLIFICFLMILCGLLITLRATEHTFNISNETKVRYSLKTAYPGMIMAIAGCLLLAYSIYKSSRLQFETTQQLIALGRTGTEAGNGRNPGIVIPPDPDTAITEAAAAKSTEEVSPPAEPEPQEKTLVREAPGPSVTTVREKDRSSFVSAADVEWADGLAARSIAYGYYPTKADKRRYEDIHKRLRMNVAGYHANPELHWAFALLQRTQDGYEPSAAEMRRYESVISRYIAGKGKSREKGGGSISGYPAGKYP